MADLNGDGRPDLVFVSQSAQNVGSATVFLNSTPTGAAVPTFAPGITFTVGSNPDAVVVVNFNGDGRPDLAVANGNNAGLANVTVLLNTTPVGAVVPSFAPQQSFTAGHSPFYLAVGDFNGDGRPDLAVANFNQAAVLSVLLNTTPTGAGAPSFAPQQTFTAGHSSFNCVAAADFNDDGRPDLVVSNFSDNTLSVLLNTTPAGANVPVFAPEQTFNVGNGPASVVVGDFNGDGRPDLAVPVINDGVVSVLLNTMSAGATNPSFAAAQTFTVGASPVSMAVGDFNGDGRPDLVTGNVGDGTTSALLNTTTPFAHPTPVVVANFSSQGLVAYNRFTQTWAQLNAGNATNASLLAVNAAGYVAFDYPHYGVYRYSPFTGVITMVNGMDANALAIEADGTVVVSIPTFGIGLFRLDDSTLPIGPAAASQLAVDANGDVVGEFPGYGVWRFRPANGSWRQINGMDAAVISEDARGDAVLSYAAFGVAAYRLDGSIATVDSTGATRLATDAYGDAALSASGQGVQEFLPAVGLVSQFPNAASLLAMDANGDIYADFTTYGVWEFDPYQGWHKLNPSDVSLLVVA